MSRFQQATARLGTQTEREVRALWARHEAGEIDRATFVTLAAARIARSNRRAVAMADLALATRIAQVMRRPPTTLGLLPDDREVDQPRIAKSVRTVLAEQIVTAGSATELAESRATRLGRLARAETQSTVQDATQRGMAERQLPGWTRETDPDPCPLCTGWADGVVRRPTVRMIRHVGCSCVQQPVI